MLTWVYKGFDIYNSLGSTQVAYLPVPALIFFILPGLSYSMKEKIPENFLNSEFRKEMWKNSKEILKKLEKILPITSIYLLGSFTTAKKRPQDIDVVILLKTKAEEKKEWSVDFQVVPDNAYGEWMLEECRKWMKRKYGARKSAVIKLK